MGCGCLTYGLNACSSAPITERKQLKIIPENKLDAQAAKIYEKIKEKINETNLYFFFLFYFIWSI